MLLKLYHQVEKEGTLLNSFYNDNIILATKSDTETTAKERKNKEIKKRNKDNGCKYSKNICKPNLSVHYKEHVL